MDANREISEIVNIKKPDNLSTLKDNDKRGRDETILKENTDPKIITFVEETNPAMDPNIAKEFPHRLDNWSFFINTKDPIPPIIHRRRAARKKFDDVNMILSIFISFYYWKFLAEYWRLFSWVLNQALQVFGADGKVLFLEMAGLPESENLQELRYVLHPILRKSL